MAYLPLFAVYWLIVYFLASGNKRAKYEDEGYGKCVFRGYRKVHSLEEKEAMRVVYMILLILSIFLEKQMLVVFAFSLEYVFLAFGYSMTALLVCFSYTACFLFIPCLFVLAIAFIVIFVVPFLFLFLIPASIMESIGESIAKNIKEPV